MSLFAQAAAIGDAAGDLLYGEQVLVEPRLPTTGRGGGGGPDPGNPPFDAVAIVDLGSAVNRTPQSSARASQAPDVVVEKSTADFAVGQFTPERMPCTGWTVVLIERSGRPRFRIARPDPDGLGRIVCTLEQEAKGP